MEEATIFLEPGQYLSDVIESLPHGIIDKRATGIGATYREITDQSRSSIIVCPSRALAATKAIKHNILYKGSPYPGVTILNIDRVRERMNQANQIIKIMVVADSLPALLFDLGPQVYKYFHITFDEIDSFQLESDFRPALLLSYMEYFNFPINQRRMVSATIQGFSDPRLMNEPKTVVESLGNQRNEIVTVHALNELLHVVIDIIIGIHTTHPTRKILIAFNSITDIIAIKNILGQVYEGSIGILCSEQSQERITGFEARIDNGILSHQITFATSVYFVGFDIDEELSILIVNDVNNIYTLIPEPRIPQIFGRARLGCLNRVFIFNTSDRLRVNLSDFQNELNHKINFCNEVIQLTNSDVARNIPTITMRDFRQDVSKSIKHAGQSILQECGEKLILNHLIIDQLLIRQNSINQLYTNPLHTVDCLFNLYNTVNYSFELSLSEDQAEVLRGTNVPTDQTPENWLISNLEAVYTIVPNPPRSLSSEAVRTGRQVIRLVNECTWINRQGVIDLFREINGRGNFSRSIQRLKDILDVYTRPRDGELWRNLSIEFRQNEKYSSSEVREGIQRAFAGLADRSLMPGGNSDTVYLQWFRKIFVTSTTSRGPSRNNRYKIVQSRWTQLSVQNTQ